MQQGDIRSILLGYIGSAASTGSGLYLLAQQLQTFLGLVAVTLGIIGGILTAINQWRRFRDYKRPL